MKKPSPRILALGALLAMPALAEESAIRLVHGNPAGYAYESRVDIPAGDYYAAVCEPDCVLRKAKVAVRQKKVAGYDGPTDGFVVSVKKPEASLFLVRGLKSLREGPLKTWYFNAAFQKSVFAAQAAEGNLSSPQALSVDVDGKPLSIAGAVSMRRDASCPADAQCPRFPEVKWKYRFGEVERTLFTLGGNELGSPLGIDEFVVWIGDLDGDGKPDLVVRPQDRSDYLELSLFLSSTLAPGKAWRPSAKFYWWDPTNPGC